MLSFPRVVAASQHTITWTAPAECPTESEVRARARRLLESDVEANASASVEVDRAGDGYRARIHFSSTEGSGQRLLDDARCDRLADEVALVFALSSPARSKPAISPIRWMIGVRLGGVLGPLPALAPAAATSLALEVSQLRFELHAGYGLPQTAALRDDVLSGRFRLAAVGARAGGVLRFGRAELVPTAGVEVVYISATGHGGETSQTGYAASWGPALGVLVRLRVSDHWAFGVAADGFTLLARSRFVFRDAGPLHRPAAVALSLGGLAEFRL
jgi:hypothetical protein